MHKHTLSIFLAVSFIILGDVSIASAQLDYGSAVKVNIPYDFMVRENGFPAGEYSFSRMPSTKDSSSLLIMRGTDGKAIILNTVADESLNGYRNTAVVLEGIDGRYFLSKVTLEGMLRGYAIPKTRSQRQMIASAGTPRQIIISSGTGY